MPLTYGVEEDQTSKGFYNSESVRRIAGRAFESQFDYANWRRREASEDQLLEVAVAYAGLRSGTVPSRIEPNELVRFDAYREVAPEFGCRSAKPGLSPMLRKRSRASSS